MNRIMNKQFILVSRSLGLLVFCMLLYINGTLKTESTILNCSTDIDPVTIVGYAGQSSTSIRLRWQNPSSYDAIRIYRGSTLVKTISSDDKSSENNSSEEDSNVVKSKLMIYGDDWFISDQTVQSGQYQSYVVDLGNNADVALNSIAYLTNNDQDITIRKTYSDSETTFTPTDKEKLTIMYIIFVVPLVIIVIGIVVWLTRKHRV